MKASEKREKAGFGVLNIGPAKGRWDEPRYQPTAEEQTILDKQQTRMSATRIAPRIKLVRINDGWSIKPNHPDEEVARSLLMEAIGTTSRDFLDDLLNQMLSITSERGQPNEIAINSLLSTIINRKPNDETEAMLVAQTAMGHWVAATILAKAATSNSTAQLDSAARAAQRLMQLLPLQMEAFKRNRTGGEPTVTVQHVSVNDNAQAIVGNISQASSRENMLDKPAPASPPALTRDKTPPMTTLEDSKDRAVVPRYRPKSL
jgi:hypothetical protein